MAILGRLDGWVEKGGQSVLAGGISSTSTVQLSYPSTTVTIYNAGTLVPATIFSDAASTAKANPFTADANGYWFFWAAPGDYDITFGSPASHTRASMRISALTISTTTSTVNVADYATAGAGTLASPWTDWDTAIAWAGTPGTGTISVANGTSPQTVTGSGTSFTTQFSVGGFIASGGGVGQITAITNNLTMTVSQWLGPTRVAQAFTIYTPKSYHFVAGVYAYATSPAFGLPFTQIAGDGVGTIFKHTGAGVAFNVSPPLTGVGAGAFGASFAGFSIQGNAGTTIGLNVGHMNHASFRDILVQNATTTGIAITNVVGGTWTNVRYSANEASPNTPAPTTGWALSSVTLLDLFGCLAEGAGTGVSLVGSAWVHWNGGTIEGSSSVGLTIDSTSNNCTFIGTDLESNTTADVQLFGYSNSFINLNSTGTFAINPSAGNGNNNLLLNGSYNAITISGTATRNSLIGVVLGLAGGVLTDTGSNTTKINVVNGATGKFEPTQLSEHMKFLGVALTAGSASGSTGATMGFDAGSTDTSGIIAVTQTNTAPGVLGAVTATYANAFPVGTVPRIIVTLMSGSIAWANGATWYVAASTNTGFQINFVNAAVNFAAGTYKIVYFILG